MERWRTHTEESVEGGYTREKEERTTENKMERRVSTRFEKYWTEIGRGDGQGDVEKKDHQLYRRPYMMGNARGKVCISKFCLPLPLFPGTCASNLLLHSTCPSSLRVRTSMNVIIGLCHSLNGRVGTFQEESLVLALPKTIEM